MAEQQRDWRGRYMWTGDFAARLCVRLTRSEADELRERAKSMGITISDYIRQLIAREGDQERSC